ATSEKREQLQWSTGRPHKKAIKEPRLNAYTSRCYRFFLSYLVSLSRRRSLLGNVTHMSWKEKGPATDRALRARRRKRRPVLRLEGARFGTPRGKHFVVQRFPRVERNFPGQNGVIFNPAD
ncbi:hypothetical protein TSAR_008723, partial [Trichomalopsis sarcophagae]